MSILQHFFTLNDKDNRWKQYIEAIKLFDNIPFEPLDEVSNRKYPHLWLMMHVVGYNNKLGKQDDEIHPDFENFIKDMALYHRDIFTQTISISSKKILEHSTLIDEQMKLLEEHMRTVNPPDLRKDMEAVFNNQKLSSDSESIQNQNQNQKLDIPEPDLDVSELFKEETKQSGGKKLTDKFIELLKNFSSLSSNEKLFYKTFISLKTSSQIEIELDSSITDYNNLDIVLKINLDNTPYFLQFIPTETRQIYLNTLNNITAHTMTTNTSFDLNLLKMFKAPVQVKHPNAKLIKEGEKFYRKDDNNDIQFNEVDFCQNTFFDGEVGKCQKFITKCVNDGDINECIRNIDNSNFSISSDKTFVSEMSPKTALHIVKQLGFRVISVPSQDIYCPLKKMESVTSWKNRITPTLQDDISEKFKSLSKFIEYMTSIVNYINEYPFILNENCVPMQKQQIQQPQNILDCPMLGGFSSSLSYDNISQFIKNNRNIRKQELNENKTISSDNEAMTSELKNLLSKLFNASNISNKNKMTEMDNDKIKKYLQRIDSLIQELIKVSSQKETILTAHNIMIFSPSADKSNEIFDDLTTKCQKYSNKINSAEKKLMIVIKKITN